MDDNIETHPLEPFLPENAKILMLGSFPPPKARWSMEWFYPNFQNDMWRIWGYIAYGDKNHFIIDGEKRFNKVALEDFCRMHGIALYDTATRIIRLKGNASDNFLQIIEPTDIAALLHKLPECRHIVATGQKSAETLQNILGVAAPPIGESVTTRFADRDVQFWRMPSSSRAYPRPVEWKAQFYKRLLE